MNNIAKGLVLTLAQVLIVTSLGGKLLYDRAHLPRVWVKTVPVDPNLPIRGRYVALRIVVEAEGFPEESFAQAEPRTPRGVNVPRGRFVSSRPGKLVLNGDRLVARPAPPSVGTFFRLSRDEKGTWAQQNNTLAFFIPEHAEDPSVRNEGEELWVEVTLTPKGNLRPLRLGVKKEGELKPLDLKGERLRAHSASARVGSRAKLAEGQQGSETTAQAEEDCVGWL
jgi:uncharacterized membrane-anchored protein